MAQMASKNDAISKENQALSEQNYSLQQDVVDLNEVLHNIRSEYVDKKKEMTEHIKKFQLIDKKVSVYKVILFNTLIAEKEIYDKSLYKMINLRNEIR